MSTSSHSRIKLFVYLVTVCVTVAQEYICQNEMDCGFQRFAYYKHSGKDRIYIGGKNTLIQLRLDTDLFTEEKKVLTGPKEDFVTCNPNCGGKKELKNNINKVLLVNKKSPAVIVCGSISQGTCELRNVSDISDVLDEQRQPADISSWVTPNPENDTTVAFLVPNPLHREDQAMVVGVSYSDHDFVPASQVYSLSTRLLKVNSAFKPVSQGDGIGTHIPVAITKDTYRIFHRAGFVHGNYSYLLTNQKLSHTSSGYVSKLLRVCNQKQPDVSGYNYDSMMDMEISCQAEDGSQTYRLVTAATVADVGGEKLLVAGFTDGEDPENLNSLNSSAVCVYKLEDIDRQFQRNLDDCLRGNASSTESEIYWANIQGRCASSTPLSHLIGNSSCKAGYQVRGVLSRTGWSVQNGHVLSNAWYITALQTTTVGDYSVLFIGTSYGTVLKGRLSRPQIGKIVIYKNIVIDALKAIRSDMLLDSDKTHIFILTNRKVTRMAVQNCLHYSECNTCRQSGDPYCGWCVQDQKCSLKADCKSSSLLKHWLAAVEDNRSGLRAKCPTLTSTTTPSYSNRATLPTGKGFSQLKILIALILLRILSIGGLK